MTRSSGESLSPSADEPPFEFGEEANENLFTFLKRASLLASHSRTASKCQVLKALSEAIVPF